MRNVVVPIVTFIAAQIALSASAAELGTQFDNYEDMHLKSRYGALFFAEGSTQSAEIPANRRFVVISGEGELVLPSQRGYCFVLNHYNRELGFQNVLLSYYGNITKWAGNKKTRPDELVKRRIIPTADGESADIADVCTDGFKDVSRIVIEFGMEKAPGAHQTISFKLQQP